MTPDKQNTQESVVGVAKGSVRFLSGTLVSRITGFGREVVMAAIFGVNAEVAAFWMAFRFIYLVRRIFGEGALNIAFVPHFEHLRAQSPQKCAQFFRVLTRLCAFVLSGIVVVGEGVLGSFYLATSGTTHTILGLAMVQLPALPFICLYALNCAFLHCERTFFLPSVAPAALNGVWIIATLMLAMLPCGQALYLLSAVVVGGCILQWGLTARPARAFVNYALPVTPLQEEGRALRALLRPFALAVLGVVATQINSAVDTLFAYGAEAAGPAYLWYAMRLQQLPLALFGVGMTSALLPSLTRALQQGRNQEAASLLNFAFKRVCVWLLPITTLIFLLGYEGVALVYGHGHMTLDALVKTSHCLYAYGAGLLPTTCLLILGTVFYAHKNYKTPALLACGAVFLNILLNGALVYGLGAPVVAVAWATSFVVFLNICAFGVCMRYPLPQGFRGVGVCVCKLVVACLCAGMLGYVLDLGGTHLWALPTTGLGACLLHILLKGVGFLATFLGISHLLGLKEVTALTSLKK